MIEFQPQVGILGTALLTLVSVYLCTLFDRISSGFMISRPPSQNTNFPAENLLIVSELRFIMQLAEISWKPSAGRFFYPHIIRKLCLPRDLNLLIRYWIIAESRSIVKIFDFSDNIKNLRDFVHKH
jgi:hypothetical protein